MQSLGKEAVKFELESFHQSSKKLREDLLVLYLLPVAGEGTIYPLPLLEFFWRL